ncbi:MAG: efflux RND transporter periplasmic adaptor subunit [Bryobacterales bacterium]|nr:efflux RND transporter periplasmic adaptor subunit [Bryobacterales bacterium]
MNRRFVCLVPAGLLMLCVSGCGRRGPEPAPSPQLSKESREDGRIVLPPDSPKLQQIRVVIVAVRGVPEESLTAPGKVEVNPNRVSRVLLPVPGRVRQVLVSLGDTVGEGQAVVTLESREADAAISEMSQLRARRRQRLSALGKAEKDLARADLLYKNRAAALKDVLQAENELVQAQSEVQASQAEEDEAQKRLEVLGLKLDGSEREVTVRAPIAGRVLETAVAPGEYRTDTAASLMTVADLSTVWVTSNVPEGSIRLVQVGEPVEIALVAYPGETFRGCVTRIADMVDAETRTVKVHVELPNPQGRFRPGMFGSISHSHGLRSVPVVPAEAVVRSGGRAFVYREAGAGVFDRVEVSVDAPLNGIVPVRSGLRAGERVIADGAVLLAGN